MDTQSPLTAVERERLGNVVKHIRKAFDAIGQAVDEYEKEHGLEVHGSRELVFEIVRSGKYDEEEKVEKLAGIMKSYMLVCGMDDLRNEIRYILGHFEGFLNDGRFAGSDVKRFRMEFYELLSSVLITEPEWFGSRMR